MNMVGKVGIKYFHTLLKSNIYSASQESLQSLQNKKFRFYVQMSPPQNSILSLINEVCTLPLDLFEVNFNIIVPIRQRFSNSSLLSVHII